MASSIALREGDVLIGDSLNNTLTVFRVNGFGEQVQELTDLTLGGNYLEAKAGWQEVMQQDRSLQAAYRGLARAYLTEGDYRQAMTVAKDGYDRAT